MWSCFLMLCVLTKLVLVVKSTCPKGNFGSYCPSHNSKLGGPIGLGVLLELHSDGRFRDVHTNQVRNMVLCQIPKSSVPRGQATNNKVGNLWRKQGRRIGVAPQNWGNVVDAKAIRFRELEQHKWIVVLHVKETGATLADWETHCKSVKGAMFWHMIYPKEVAVALDLMKYFYSSEYPAFTGFFRHKHDFIVDNARFNKDDFNKLIDSRQVLNGVKGWLTEKQAKYYRGNEKRGAELMVHFFQSAIDFDFRIIPVSGKISTHKAWTICEIQYYEHANYPQPKNPGEFGHFVDLGTKSLYGFSFAFHFYSQAEKNCKATGGKLFIPSDKIEFRSIAMHLKNNYKGKLNARHTFWTGIFIGCGIYIYEESKTMSKVWNYTRYPFFGEKEAPDIFEQTEKDERCAKIYKKEHRGDKIPIPVPGKTITKPGKNTNFTTPTSSTFDRPIDVDAAKPESSDVATKEVPPESNFIMIFSVTGIVFTLILIIAFACYIRCDKQARMIIIEKIENRRKKKKEKKEASKEKQSTEEKKSSQSNPTPENPMPI